jgi:hypothetical protein
MVELQMMKIGGLPKTVDRIHVDMYMYESNEHDTQTVHMHFEAV